MQTVFQKPSVLTDVPMHYCPGCTHGIVHRLVAQALEELGAEGKAVGVASVGCSVMCYDYFSCDMVQAPHGRAQAVATGLKRAKPENVIFTYQGDGDLAAIGSAETIHACTRGENIVIIMINNGIYGMTGGQMSPCTILGAKTATSPYGRRADLNGFPLKVSNMVALLDGTCYVTRQAVHTVQAVRKAKNALKKAFKNAIEKKGTSFIEIVGTCSSGWKLTPEKSNKWMEENMFANYPLGDIKDTSAGLEEKTVEVKK